MNCKYFLQFICGFFSAYGEFVGVGGGGWLVLFYHKEIFYFYMEKTAPIFYFMAGGFEL